MCIFCKKKINIKGLKDFEGKGVSYCTTCDGFFYRDMSVGVLGHSAYAVHEAIQLEAYTKDITIFTNGAELDLTGELAYNAILVDHKQSTNIEGVFAAGDFTRDSNK